MFYQCLIPELPAIPSGNLKISDLGDNDVQIEWQAPKYDGGAPISHYLIDIRESRRTAWSRVAKVEPHVHKFAIRDLVIGELRRWRHHFFCNSMGSRYRMYTSIGRWRLPRRLGTSKLTIPLTNIKRCLRIIFSGRMTNELSKCCCLSYVDAINSFRVMDRKLNEEFSRKNFNWQCWQWSSVFACGRENSDVIYRLHTKRKAYIQNNQLYWQKFVEYLFHDSVDWNLSVHCRQFLPDPSIRCQRRRHRTLSWIRPNRTSEESR